MDMGYEPFFDKVKLGARFITDDIFSAESTLAAEFTRSFGIIHASNFFHLWCWDKQIEAAKRVVELLVPQPGSMIIGSQVGSKRARLMEFPVLKVSLFMQSLETFRRLWEVVGMETGVEFEVKVEEHRRLIPGPRSGSLFVWFLLSEGFRRCYIWPGGSHKGPQLVWKQSLQQWSEFQFRVYRTRTFKTISRGRLEHKL